jgi:hypothetical protein
VSLETNWMELGIIQVFQATQIANIWNFQILKSNLQETL